MRVYIANIGGICTPFTELPLDILARRARDIAAIHDGSPVNRTGQSAKDVAEQARIIISLKEQGLL